MFLVLIFLVGSICTHCKRKDCYQIIYKDNPYTNLRLGNPVFLEGAIVGSIDNVKVENGSSIAKFCISAEVGLSANSTFTVGFVREHGSNGVNIDLVDSKERIDSSLPILANWVDSLSISSPRADTVIRNIIQKLEDMTAKDSLRKDSLK